MTTLVHEGAPTLSGEGGAVFSEDRAYRYLLTRDWPQGDQEPLVLLMLNPSTAGAEINDNTVRRGIGFARRERCRGLVIPNLFALCATDPAELRRHPDPVGQLNDDFIIRHCLPGRLVVAAWGVHGAYLGRAAEVTQLLAARGVSLRCLGTTKAGYPRHPLYVRGDQPLIPFGGQG